LARISKTKSFSNRQKDCKRVEEYIATQDKFNAIHFGPFKELLAERVALYAEKFGMVSVTKKKGAAESARSYPRVDKSATNHIRSLVQMYGVDTSILANQNKLFRNANALKPSEVDFLFAQTQISKKYGPEYRFEDLVLPEVEKRVKGRSV
jgi:hypothetical protein